MAVFLHCLQIIEHQLSSHTLLDGGNYSGISSVFDFTRILLSSVIWVPRSGDHDLGLRPIRLHFPSCKLLQKYDTSESESEVAQSCPTLCNPMDCSPPGSSIHGLLQARILEWVAISFSKWTYLQNRNRFTGIENRPVDAKDGGGFEGGMGWEFGVSRYKLLYIIWINNTILLYSTGNCIQHSVINHKGKEYKIECVCVCVCVCVQSSLTLWYPGL